MRTFSHWNTCSSSFALSGVYIADWSSPNSPALCLLIQQSFLYQAVLDASVFLSSPPVQLPMAMDMQAVHIHHGFTIIILPTHCSSLLIPSFLAFVMDIAPIFVISKIRLLSFVVPHIHIKILISATFNYFSSAFFISHV